MMSNLSKDIHNTKIRTVMTKKSRPIYRVFKHYVRFLMNHLMYRKRYIIGHENLPALGEPFVIPANHQNTAMDPLILLLDQDNAMHPYVLAMGGVFTWSPIINSLWDWLGMLPAFRMDYEGMDASFAHTGHSIDFASQKLAAGDPVIIFPEANHHQEYWMRVWQQGFLRIAFQAAEATGFKQDIKIVPTAHHYSSFYGLQQDYMIHYGEAVSLAPYYERYQQKPRTVIRELVPIFREKVKEKMLYIEDLEHHDAYEFVRSSAYGERYARKHQLDPTVLPEKLKADQMLIHELEVGAERHPGMIEQIHKVVDDIRAQKKQLHIREHFGEQPLPSAGKLTLTILAQLLLLPVFLFSLVPNAIFYFLPPVFMPGKEDSYYNMYRQAMIFIVNVLLIIPIFSLTAILVCGLHWGLWWAAVLWVLSWYPMAFFAWYVGNWMRDTFDALSLICHRKQAAHLQETYKQFYSLVMQILR